MLFMKKANPHPKPSKPRYFFKEWRKFRGMTQDELAEAVGVSTPSISQLERGVQGFTDSTLEALSIALACTPGDLLMRNPLDTDAPWSLWDAVKRMEKPKRDLIVASVEAMMRTGTDG